MVKPCRIGVALVVTTFVVTTKATHTLAIGTPLLMSSPTCMYENIAARCGELMIITTAYGDRFAQAEAAITARVQCLGGSVWSVDATLNHIIVRFERAADLTRIKHRLEAMPEINSVAYSMESMLDAFKP